MKNNLLRMGYVMVSRALLQHVYEKQGAANSDEEAFLRVLIHVNYKNVVVSYNGREIICMRGESMISYLGWADILGWTRSHTRCFFDRCVIEGTIERVPDDCPSHIRVVNYDAWTGNLEGRKPGERRVDEALQNFIARYSEVTRLPVENKAQISKIWKHLSARERELALERIEDYYYSLANIKYCYGAARYLESKVFDNDFRN